MKKSDFLKTAIKAAKAAGKISKKHFNKTINISYKKRNEIVTDVDKENEKAILKIIKNKYPTHSIWSEESPEEKNNSKFRWVIDPLDGTFMYAQGIPLFGISIGLEKNGKSIVGVNYFPILNKLYFAEKNKGAYLNNKQIKVNKKNKNKLYFVSSQLIRKPSLMKNFNEDFIKRKINVKSLGCCSLELSFLAEGKATKCYEYKIKPGDISASIIIVREANGKVVTLNGKNASSKDSEIIAKVN